MLALFSRMTKSSFSFACKPHYRNFSTAGIFNVSYRFFSCLPTATTQVYLTQVYSGTGTAEHLAAFLIPQYALMFISMTALNAYAIQSIF